MSRTPDGPAFIKMMIVASAMFGARAYVQFNFQTAADWFLLGATIAVAVGFMQLLVPMLHDAADYFRDHPEVSRE